ncbi:MogA/MoaB family molybdenum cofactor biosynthesis protein [Staphylococcus kloosii]|uniref:MogA/MoaB family molybdenum cofactor biosynthesis protein n=1 Tax=Staphylococcus kloosii TaxID=29384 RepID=UPI0028A52891|nr:MogA/MoaB family molybdenum cofactor biosynthesis protein [Staphylococcus kloosii]MDT3959047.1 MogA/MoaB family molybdenum cofactor biosynthesis protein [Staphylococcus kloosii]
MHSDIKLTRKIQSAVLTISDTRDYKTDKSGQLIKSILAEENVEVREEAYKIVKDEPQAIQTQIGQWLKSDVDVIITTGGTGISPRDITIETIRPLFTKEIEGFGELFRYLSYTEDVGTKALLSRAVAGTANDKLIFCLPGSSGAVTLALNKLIKPELNHLVHELTK